MAKKNVAVVADVPSDLPSVIKWEDRLPRTRNEQAVQQLQREIDEFLSWKEVEAKAKRELARRRDALKVFMLSNGVDKIHSPEGAVASVSECRSSQPDRTKARELLTEEQYRAIFEDLPMTTRINIK